jgi:5-methylcytosine-specific restriction endonuclease McrA
VARRKKTRKNGFKNMEQFLSYLREEERKKLGCSRRLQRVYHMYRGCCAFCHKKLQINESTIDHLYPKARGGSNDLENIVLSCEPCNQNKGCRTPREADMPLLAETAGK